MADAEKKQPSLKSAGIEEKKILKSLNKLQRYPKVREIFREAASLFRQKKIKKIKDIGLRRDIKKMLSELNNEERQMYKKHLRGMGFPSIMEIIGKERKAALIMKTGTKAASKKAFDIKETSTSYKDEIEEIKDRGQKPILKVLNDHIQYLGDESFFQRAHKTAKQTGIIERSRSSIDFYEDYAAQYATSFTYRKMFREGGKKRANFFLGRMYFYKYMPNMETLDSDFDMYPLMFILDKADQEFEVINFHFMPPKARAMTMGNLLDYLNNEDYTPNTKIIFSSLKKVIRNNRKFRYAKYAYRRYRFDGIASKIIEVHPLDWQIAMFCPTERFYSSKRRRLPDRTIWKRTAIRVRKRK